MDMLTLVAFIAYGYGMYTFGKYTSRRIFDDKVVSAVVAKANVPIGVIEQIEGHYYVYEKDSTNFLCQAEKLEDIPMNLWENKKISLAVILYPEIAGEKSFWCINGKLRVVE